MSKLTSALWQNHYYDHLDGKPLKGGDMVKAYFPSGHVLETTISLKERGVSSSPGFGDVYEFEAYLNVPYYGIMGTLSLREHPQIRIERMKPSQREKTK